MTEQSRGAAREIASLDLSGKRYFLIFPDRNFDVHGVQLPGLLLTPRITFIPLSSTQHRTLEMLSWFLQQCDADSSFVQNPNSVTYHFETPAFLFYGLPLVAVLGSFIFWRQRRNLRSAPLSLILSLTTCRVVILALLVVVLASPFVRRTDVEEKKPIVAILFDDSQSMGLASGSFEGADETVRKLAIAAGYQIAATGLDPSVRKEFNDKTRAKLVQTIVQAQKAQLLEPLAKKYELRFYRFGRDARRISVDPVQWELPEPAADGSGTHIADSVLKVMAEAAGRPVAGLILFSDGENTGGQPLTKASDECLAKSTPLFALPAGSGAKSKDVSIVDLSTAGQVTLGDTARVGVVIESTGYEGKTVKLELFDGTALLDTKEITLRGGRTTASRDGVRCQTAGLADSFRQHQTIRG